MPWSGPTPTRLGAVLLLAASLTVSTSSVTLAADGDHDGLRDGFEARYGVTSPDRQDSDWDGVVDSAEDSDGDCLANLGEQRFGTDPGRRDSDGDGTPDGVEDHDRDGRSNVREQEQRPVPTGVKPSLSWAKRDRAVIAKHCVVGFASTQLLRCHDGDPDGERSIVLLGDSHATAMFDPLRRAARTEGWHVTSMLNGACLPFPGLMNKVHHELDGGAACRTWRSKALAALRAEPPDLLVVTANAEAALVYASGAKVPRSAWPARWAAATGQLIDALPARTTLLLLGDVPHTNGQPVTCLKRHPGDMSRCVTWRKPLAGRPVERAQRTVIADRGQRFATLHGKICPSDPCPLVQGTALVWRSHGHLSATFARRLTPSLRKVLHGVLD